MRTFLRQFFAVAAFLLVVAQPGARVLAQQATISGITATADGARLPHAVLTLIDATGRTYRSASNELGTFAFGRLPPGTYTLTIEFPGLSTRTIEGLVVPGAPPVDVMLEPVQVREVVTVSAAVPRDSVEMASVRESPARDVGELLADTAGLWKLRKGAIANDVVLRGLQSRDLNVLLDGNRLYGACPNHMDPPAFHVDFSQVERVDVGKGPFDVRYQGSLGGIVNIVTRKPEAGWNADLAFGGGAFGFVNPSATVSYGGARASVLGGISYRRSAPYSNGQGQLMTAATNYRPDTMDSDAFRATTMWGRAAWRPAEGHQVEASYTRQATDHVLYPYLQMDAVWDDADRAAVDYSAPAIGWFSSLKAQAYWSAVDHWMTDQLRSSSLTALREYSMGTDATTQTLGGRVEARRGATTVGAELYRRNWNSATLLAGMNAYAPQYSIPDVNIDSAGVFAEHTRVLGARMALDLGGRLDRLSTTADAARANVALYTAYHGAAPLSRVDTPLSGRARLTVQAGRGLSVAAALGHTARVAEGNERFFALRRAGTDWVGNPGLDPVRNTGVDVSMTLQRSRVTLSTNAYVNAVHDYIAVYGAQRQVAMSGVMNTVARSYANVDARLRGMEASGSLTLHRALTLSGDLSYVRGTMTPDAARGIASTDLAETPPLRSRLRLRADDGRVFVEIEGVASAAQGHVDRTLGEQPTASYGIVNLSSGWRRGALGMSVGVSNLLDTYYVEHLSFQRDPYRTGIRVAEPGRNVFTNVNWRF